MNKNYEVVLSEDGEFITKLQIADTNKGGASTWDENESSVRIAQYKKGKFISTSSPEISSYNLETMVIECAKEDFFSNNELVKMLELLTASLARQYSK